MQENTYSQLSNKHGDGINVMKGAQDLDQEHFTIKQRWRGMFGESKICKKNKYWLMLIGQEILPLYWKEGESYNFLFFYLLWYNSMAPGGATLYTFPINLTRYKSI